MKDFIVAPPLPRTHDPAAAFGITSLHFGVCCLFSSPPSVLALLFSKFSSLFSLWLLLLPLFVSDCNFVDIKCTAVNTDSTSPDKVNTLSLVPGNTSPVLVS